MVLLIEKLYNSLKPSSKLENHHHHHHHNDSDALPVSLQAFQSEVSNSLNQVLLNSIPGSDFLSLSWILQCLELLSNVNKAFAKLAMEIDYPTSKWDVHSFEEYLNYSLKLLDFLNSISSSLSHLNQSLLSISFALSMIDNPPQSAIKHLRTIQFKNPNKDLTGEEMEEIGEEKLCSSKECVLHQAMKIMKRNGYWVCGIVLAGLSGDDIRPCLEMEKTEGKFLRRPSIKALEKREVLKEVKDVNDAVGFLVEAIAAGESTGARKELGRRLELMQKLVDGIGKEADGMFSEILAGRNELLDGLRQWKP